jgi:hypothetical protein
MAHYNMPLESYQTRVCSDESGILETRAEDTLMGGDKQENTGDTI